MWAQKRIQNKKDKELLKSNIRKMEKKDNERLKCNIRKMEIE